LLSILIPTYGYDSRPLVQDLHRIGEELGIPFEILVADDCPPVRLREMEQINRLDNARYWFLEKNLGRSGCRNFLAEKAKYDFLLFIDGDMKVTCADYLDNYRKQWQAGTVLCGGHVYQSTPPDSRLRLHWRYGRSREVRPAQARNRSPYESFMSSNFIISKEAFRQIRFDEKLTGYGHEDTLFGHHLREKGIAIRHIDNPLIHLGLTQDDVFLQKTIEAIENLKRLENQYGLTVSKLQRTAKRLDFLRPFLRRLPDSFLRKRILQDGSLRWLDLYKLKKYLEA